jgi:hypothetical protein
MNLLLLVLLIQAPAPQPPNFLTTPDYNKTVQRPAVEAPTPKQILPPSEHNTTPTLSLDSEVVHAQLERDIGGQGEAIGELKAKVGSLEDKRENHDRPDINSLQSSRFHLRLLFSLLGIAILVLWWAKGFLWRDTIRPWLRRSLSNEAKSASPEID